MVKAPNPFYKSLIINLLGRPAMMGRSEVVRYEIEQFPKHNSFGNDYASRRSCLKLKRVGRLVPNVFQTVLKQILYWKKGEQRTLFRAGNDSLSKV